MSRFVRRSLLILLPVEKSNSLTLYVLYGNARFVQKQIDDVGIYFVTAGIGGHWK